MLKVASIPSPYHLSRGVENQDAYFYEVFEEYTIAAVADGGGSYSRALEGARMASQWCVDYIVNNLQMGVPMLESLERAVESTSLEMKELEDYKEYSSTLAVAVKSPENVVVGVVGDAFAVVIVDEEFFLVRPDPIDPLQPSVTSFITSDDYRFVSREFPSGVVVLCSDGMDFGSLQNGTLFEGFWKPFYEELEDLDLSELLVSMKKADKIIDDTTILAF